MASVDDVLVATRTFVRGVVTNRCLDEAAERRFQLILHTARRNQAPHIVAYLEEVLVAAKALGPCPAAGNAAPEQLDWLKTQLQTLTG